MKLASLLLFLAAATVALPAAAADPEDTVVPPGLAEVHTPDPDPVRTAADETLERLWLLIAINPGLGNAIDYESVSPTVTVECTVLSTGARQCTGLVCWSDSGRGTIPVSPGRPDEGIVGVGYAEDEDGDGWYGPYSGVYVSLGGNCGCTVGVGIRWIEG